MSIQTEKIIKENIGLVHSIAKKFQSSTIPYEDLVQEGMIALWEAAKRYDSGKDAKFSTYAFFWIKKRILAAVEKEKSDSMNSIKLTEETTVAASEKMQSNTLKLPDSIPEIEKKILKLHFEKEFTLREIAAELSISREKVRQLREKALRRMRLFQGK